MKNLSEKVVLKAMGEKAKERLTELKNCPNGMLNQVRVQ